MAKNFAKIVKKNNFEFHPIFQILMSTCFDHRKSDENNWHGGEQTNKERKKEVTKD